MTNVSEIPKHAKADERRDVLIAGITASVEYARDFEQVDRRRRVNAFLCGYLTRNGDGELLVAIRKIIG